MKAAIYSPYWDTYGGGEKYAAAVAKTLIDHGYEVEIWWPQAALVTDIKKRYGIDIHQVKLNQDGFHLATKGNFWQKRTLHHQFDLLFWVSDGSIPWLWARRNLIHFQVPFHDLARIAWWNHLKFLRIAEVVCNSKFTKQVIDQSYQVKSVVVYPPATMFTAGNKEQLILSVGRFDNLMQSKRHDVLIEAFKQLKRSGWRLVLAGGVLHGNVNVKSLYKLIGDDDRITVITNPPYSQLKKLYETAKIYWHATGYGMDLLHHPEKAEHFGITTVEAMSAGATALVFNGGGQREIVHNGKDGFVWDTPEQLVKLTQKLIDHPTLYQALSLEAEQTAQHFSMKEFGHALAQYIG